jgi:hypothetical protein
MLLKRMDKLNEDAQIKTSDKQELKKEVEVIKSEIRKLQILHEQLENRLGQISFTSGRSRGTSYNQKRSKNHTSLQSIEITADEFDISEGGTARRKQKKKNEFMRQKTQEGNSGCQS